MDEVGGYKLGSFYEFSDTSSQNVLTQARVKAM